MALLPIQLQILAKTRRSLNHARKYGKALSQRKHTRCCESSDRHYIRVNSEGEVKHFENGVTDGDLLRARINVLKAKLSFPYFWQLDKEKTINEINRIAKYLRDN